MNKRNIILLLSLNLTSSDEVDELTEVDFSTTLTEEVLVSLS